jgi:acyl-CoA thioester hydrolase
MQEYWRGSVNQWECDEMGHMNVRFWVRRSMEGLAVMAPAFGLPHAFRAGSGATILPLDQHIKFIREAHAGAPLFLRGGVVAIDETTATLYQEVVHAISGEIGATFRTIIAHVEAKTGQQFPWSDKARTAMAAHLVSVPEHGLPRSVPYDDPPATDAGVARADTLGVTRVGLMPVSPDELDNFGRIRAELFIGRVSDAVPNLMTQWRKQVAEAAKAADGVARRPGAAVLEYRLAYRAWPRAGDIMEIRSGVTWVKDKTHALVHWILDPQTGQAWCTCQAVAITLDLIARKAMATPEAQRKLLEEMAIPALSI